ncbi:MAG: PASTA domain-containing protein [Prevotella sp.]|nr:PASTA domain-containing protein [Prevotella sp.]
MKSRVFFGKFVSAYLLGHLAAMAAVLALLCFGVKYGLEVYTHHGESIPVPDLNGMDYEKAYALLERNGLRVVVSDSGYNKRLPANCVLAQNPCSGLKVKTGHVIYVTVNSSSSPTLVIPDLIDNSSAREAKAKLTAMGFRLLEPQYVTGEKDWVYGIICRGHRVASGDVVSIETPLTLVIGSGTYDDSETGMDFDAAGYEDVHADADEFEEVEAPPAAGETETPDASHI